MYLSEHFKENELLCKCGCEPTDLVRANLKILASHLEKLRWLGPIIVTSGHRCMKHNEQIGGAKGSKHLEGIAADINVQNPAGHQYPGLFLAGVVEGLIQLGDMPEGGVGTYEKQPFLLHYDFRGMRARWRYV